MNAKNAKKLPLWVVRVTYHERESHHLVPAADAADAANRAATWYGPREGLFQVSRLGKETAVRVDQVGIATVIPR